ncbi:hypothetical protein NBH00_08895 [Paraconexibacter antarcticus]|uniref:Uncharacterized protein n=1 Tax=Paraconexibacter antarcticus TaxID=2949664 RepID=A0ABY5E0G8_9ACTN|nr:hypothetical protein [Paraconexibacter antarcticus]UTI66309.1 hypothetical protein NBH00_08895 [Paraconexibacter antarcticus]
MPQSRAPRDELADATAHGDVYLRRLRRAQLQLALLTLAAFGGLVGSLPLVVLRVDWLRDTQLLGVPLAVLLVAVPPFPLFLVLGWLHERRARTLDEAFRDLVSPP